MEWQEVTTGELEPLLARYYPEGGGVTGEQAGLSVSDDFLTRIIEEARRLGSSDVHVEVYERRGRVRLSPASAAPGFPRGGGEHRARVRLPGRCVG